MTPQDRCGRDKSPKLTAEIAANIKWLWDNTQMNQAQISATLGALNQGRVSEVVSGKRYSEITPTKFDGEF